MKKLQIVSTAVIIFLQIVMIAMLSLLLGRMRAEEPLQEPSDQASSEEDWFSPQTIEVVNDLEGVRLSFVSGDGKGCRCVLHNETDREVLSRTDFGYYQIEEQKNGSWRALPLRKNTGFSDVGYIVKAGKSVEYSFGFIPYYGELPAGRYRIVFFVLDNGVASDNEIHYVAAEFDVR